MSTIEFAHQIKIIQRWYPCTYSYLVWPSLIFSILFSESLGSLFGLKHVAACVIQRFCKSMVPIVESALALQNDSSFHNTDPLTLTICSVWWASLKDHFLELLLFYKMIALVWSCIFQDPCTYSYLVFSSLICSLLLLSPDLLDLSLFGLKPVEAYMIHWFSKTMVRIVESALALQNDSS